MNNGYSAQYTVYILPGGEIYSLNIPKDSICMHESDFIGDSHD